MSWSFSVTLNPTVHTRIDFLLDRTVCVSWIQLNLRFQANQTVSSHVQVQKPPDWFTEILSREHEILCALGNIVHFVGWSSVKLMLVQDAFIHFSCVYYMYVALYVEEVIRYRRQADSLMPPSCRFLIPAVNRPLFSSEPVCVVALQHIYETLNMKVERIWSGSFTLQTNKQQTRKHWSKSQEFYLHSCWNLKDKDQYWDSLVLCVFWRKPQSLHSHTLLFSSLRLCLCSLWFVGGWRGLRRRNVRGGDVLRAFHNGNIINTRDTGHSFTSHLHKKEKKWDEVKAVTNKDDHMVELLITSHVGEFLCLLRPSRNQQSGNIMKLQNEHWSVIGFLLEMKILLNLRVWLSSWKSSCCILQEMKRWLNQNMTGAEHWQT